MASLSVLIRTSVSVPWSINEIPASPVELKMKLSCGMDGMGSVDMELAGVMGETEFNYDSKVDVRLPMVGKVAMRGKATGKYVGACPAS